MLGIFSRAACWLVISGLVISVRGADMSDLSNDLATDLGPLLALFGDAITKQYLSESTSLFDYIIFALAPIGLMTAVVSVIRVCGGTWLRSFIGRAQEGDAAIESELCTSTSSDVCEVFNRGGITRTLGRATILEVMRVVGSRETKSEEETPQDNATSEIEDLKDDSTTTDGSKGVNWKWSRENMGLFLVRDYLRNYRDREPSEWGPEEDNSLLRQLAAKARAAVGTLRIRLSKHRKKNVKKGSDVESGDRSPNARATVPQDPAWGESEDGNPNLSINIGIEKRSGPFVVFVLVLGMVLQLGLIAMAPLLCWVGHWSKDGHEEGEPGIEQAYFDNNSPVLYIIGTVIMTAGMFGCAYLVGQITQEKRWKRRGRDPTNSAGPARTRLYWVQPGDQVIGDQTFGAYAYSEDPRQPLPEYVISTKKEEGKTLLRYRFLTWIAVIATLGGYILQFVGIRGMTAWVSIAQLGATVKMSVFRAMMRTQRLANNGNRVQDISGAIAGHELDWLAFEIWKDMEAEQHGHQQGGGREERRDSTARGDGKTVGVSWVFTGRPCSDGKMASTELNHAEDILRIRARLAYLSGHNSAFQSEKEKPRRQQWDNKYVPARDRAVKMAKALGQIADRIIDKNHPREKEIHLHFQVQFWRSAGDIKVETYPITIILYPPKPTAGRRGWSLDSQQLEAILGLYSWSLYRYREVNETPRGSWWLGAGSKLLHSKSEIDLAGDVQRAQILSSITPVGIDDQYLLDLWLGDNTPDIKSCTIKWDQTDHPDATTIWTRSPVRTEIQFPNGRPEFVFTPGKSESSDNGPNISSGNHLRFFGWSHVHHEPDFQAEEREADIYYVETNRSVLDDCAHDIFSAILSELKRQPPSTVRLLVPHGKRGLVPKPSSLPTDWQSDLLSSLTKALKDNNMGSHQDALLGILPALCAVLAKPVRESCIMMFMAIRSATEYRKRGQWLRSWRILRTVYMTGDFWNHYMISEIDVYLRNATITSLCELFCSSLQYGQEECRRALFGFEGMKWLQEVCQTWWADENRATRNRKVLDLSKQQNSLTVYCYSLIARHIMTIRVSSRPGEKGHKMLPPWQGYMPWRFMENPRDMNPRFLNLSGIPERTLERYLEMTLTGAPASKGALDTLCYLPDTLAEKYGLLGLPAKEHSLCLFQFSGVRTQLRALLLGVKLKDSVELEDSVKQILAPAAAANWHEIVEALLELGVPASYRETEESPYAFDECVRCNSADAARVLIETGEFEGFDRDIILGTSKQGSDRVLDIARCLGMCNTYEKSIPSSEDRPLASYDREKDGPMTLASKSKQPEIMEVLLHIDGISLNEQDEKGWLPIHHAAWLGNFWFVEWMLRRAPTAVDARVDHTNLTPLMLAAAGSKKNTDIIRHLKDNGAQVNAQDNKGRTPVMHAASAGRLFNLKFLLDEPSVDISIRDGEEKTVLFHLLSGKIEATDNEAKNVSLDILSLLRSRGLTPSIHARNYTALMAAAEAGNPHFIEDIIDCDDVQSWVNLQGPLKKTALMYAAESGSASGVELLLAVPDIDPMLKDQNGWTALTFAAWMGSLDMVELLLEDPRVIMALEHGPSDAMISSSIPDGRGETQRLTNTDFALKVACEREHLGVIHRLLKDGRFDPNLCDDDGYTLLHYAVVYERVEVAEVLLEYGARTDISNHSGKTALDLAKGSERMIKILEEPREKN